MAKVSTEALRVWLGHRSGHCDVHRKALTLPGHVGRRAAVQAKVIEPGLADRDHLGLKRQRSQSVEVRLLNALAVWMNTGGAPEVVMRQRQAVHHIELLERGANHQRAVHQGLGHVGAQ
jgi:hypothetical protein